MITHTDQDLFTLDGAYMHGCNCFCVQGAGIAKEMNQRFKTLNFPFEHPNFAGKGWKLGTIDAQFVHDRLIINAYTQFFPGPHAELLAIKSCFKNVNEQFPGITLAIPEIGCGIGGLKWEWVEPLLEELKDINVIVSHYKP